MKTTELAHRYWKEILKEGGVAIDATVGNGYDTHVLATLLKGKGRVIGYDIQECALEKAKKRLHDHLGWVTLIHASHEDLGEVAAKLIVYNLGYLPGGDKNKTTQTETTLKSLKHASQLIQEGGAISIVCYPGHEEGAKEEETILRWAQTLPSDLWSVCEMKWRNRIQAPSLILIWRHAKRVSGLLNS